MVLFLTNILLKEKEDFSKIWLAAHWEKKLKRYQIYQVDIEQSVKDIMDLDIILDLRLSGHLLIGIVKIFSRKTKYLLTECSDIFNRVKIFRSGITDLPPNKLKAPIKSITMTEYEILDEFNLGKIDEDNLVSHQSRVEEITLKEIAEGMQLIADDDFEFNNMDENIPINFDEELLKALENGVTSNQIRKVSQPNMIIAYGEDLEDMETGLDNEFENGYEMMDEMEDNDGQNNKYCKRHVSISKEPISIASAFQRLEKSQLNLEPLTGMLDVQPICRRKRKLIMDQVKILDKEKFDKQLRDSYDIIKPLDMAPPSKRLMILKEIGSFEKLFNLPGQNFGSFKILKLFKRNLRMRKTEENTSSSDEHSHLSPEHPRALPTENLNSPLLDLNGCDFERCENNDDSNRETSDSSHNDKEYVHENVNANKCPINFSQDMQEEAIFSQEPSEDPDSLLQKRIISLLDDMRLLFHKSKEITFSELVKYDRRVKVAGKFQSLLMLKKLNIVEVMQKKCHEEIFISKGTNFTPLSSQFT